MGIITVQTQAGSGHGMRNNLGVESFGAHEQVTVGAVEMDYRSLTYEHSTVLGLRSTARA